MWCGIYLMGKYLKRSFKNLYQNLTLPEQPETIQFSPCIHRTGINTELLSHCIILS